MSRPFNKNKTFKPIILYDSSRSQSPTPAATDDDSRAQKALVEEHRAKIKNMLDYNAQLWENEGRFYDTSSSSSNKISSAQSSSPKPTSFSDDHRYIRSHSNKSSMSFIESPNMHANTSTNDDHREISTVRSPNMKSPSKANVLEPQTQNSIPLPLYSHELLIRPPIERYNSEPSPDNKEIAYSSTNLEEEDYGEEYDGYEEPISNEQDYTTQTTTFINEPQFHHTYKPHIARKRRRGNLPKEVTEFLKRWLILHKKHPYPTESEKQKLADETGLMVNQISNWFINARRRILQPLLESENRQSKGSAEESNNYNDDNVGVNVVGSSSNDNKNNRNDSNDSNDSNETPRSINAAESSGSGSSNYHPHHHHNYNRLSISNASSLLLQQPSSEDNNLDTNTEGDFQNNVPPPWVLLPTKLPSMNILEKDLEAFEPEK